MLKNLFFDGNMKVSDENSRIRIQDPDPNPNPDPDPLVRGMDPRIRIHPKLSWRRNTVFNSVFLYSYISPPIERAESVWNNPDIKQILLTSFHACTTSFHATVRTFLLVPPTNVERFCSGNCTYTVNTVPIYSLTIKLPSAVRKGPFLQQTHVPVLHVYKLLYLYLCFK